MHVRIGPYNDWSAYELGHLVFGNPSFEQPTLRYKLAHRLGRWLEGPEDSPSVLSRIIKHLTKRRIYVYIDDYDVWNMDDTLKYVIHPMLIKLRATKQGSGMVDDDDVPPHLRSTAAGARDGITEAWELDHNFHLRYDWMLSEITWAFDPSNCAYADVDPTKDYDWENVRVKEDRITNAYRLFGKYYNTLWN